MPSYVRFVRSAHLVRFAPLCPRMPDLSAMFDLSDLSGMSVYLVNAEPGALGLTQIGR